MIYKIRTIGMCLVFICTDSFAQSNRSAPRGAPPPASSGRASSPAQSRSWSRNRGAAASFGANNPLRRSVFVPNISFEMNFFSKQNVDCPSFFTAIDEATDKKFSPNEYEYHGEAPMRWFSSAVHVVFQNQRRAIWRGQLSSEFSECHAQAVMSSWSSRSLKPSQGHLSLTLKNGTATFVADISRYKNAVLKNASVSESGRPIWSWFIGTP